MEFLRARTQEQTNARQQEIIDACTEIFDSKGFDEVTFKSISEKTSFSRPTIYNYYATKEEILLDVLSREFFGWTDSITKIIENKKTKTKAELCTLLVESLRNRDRFLKLLSIHYVALEIGSSYEKLTQFKKEINFSHNVFFELAKSVYPNITKDDVRKFHLLLMSLICGIYQRTHFSEKQVKAMETATGEKFVPFDFYELLKESLLALFAIFD